MTRRPPGLAMTMPVREIKLVSGPGRRLEQHFHEEYSLAFVHEGRSRSWVQGREALVRDALGRLAWARAGAACGGATTVLKRASGRLRRAREHIDVHFAEGLHLDELAAVAGLSKYRLIRAFKESYGLAPRAYLLCARINRAKRLLATGGRIADVALECGFCDQSHLSRAFVRRAGLAPRGYAALCPIAPKA